MFLILTTHGQDEDSGNEQLPTRNRKRNLSLVSNILEDLGFSEVI